MAVDLYLAVWDSAGVNIPGGSPVDRFVDPFRPNAPAARPFFISSWSFGAEHTAAGGAPAGKGEVGDLVVTMPDDTAAGVLFRAVCTGTVFKYVDVLAVKVGERPATIAGVGITTAVLTGISWTFDDDGPQRTLRVDGAGYAVGSAAQKADGSFGPLEIGRYDTTRGT
jgi:type VI protein secretion system component Hcp